MKIFSHPLNFSHFYLIYFHIHGISSFRDFAVPYFNRYVDSTNLSFTELVTYRNLQFDVDMLLDIFQIFSEQLFTRQLQPATVIQKLPYFEKQTLAKKLLSKISQSSQKSTCVGVSFLINLQLSC